MTAGSTARKIWTHAEILALGVRIDGVTAVEIVTGYGRSRAYELLQTPDVLPFRVLRIGRRFVVPTADVLAALGLAGELPPRSQDSAPTAPAPPLKNAA